MLNPGIFFRLPPDVIAQIDALRGTTDPKGRGRFVGEMVKAAVAPTFHHGGPVPDDMMVALPDRCARRKA